MIDIHSHVMTPEAQELVRPFFSPEKDPFFGYASSSTRAYNKEHIPEVVPALTLPDVRLRDMDRMGVDIQAISVMPPQYFYWTEPDLGGRLAGMVNDRLFEIVQDHPDRFVGLGTLPLQDVDLALAELDRVVGELRFTGLEICTNVNGLDFDDPRFVPFFEKVVEHDLLLVVHPHGFSDGRRLADYYLINTVGMPMDSTVFIARVIFGGVLERFPGLEDLCDARGRIPAVLPGALRPCVRGQRRLPRAHPPAAEHLSGADVLRHDGLRTGGDRVAGRAVGSGPCTARHGLPVRHGGDRPLGLLARVANLDEKDRGLIAGGNAARLLRLDR